MEQALQIADDGDDVEVIALTVGPDDAADAIKRSLQMGASGGHPCARRRRSTAPMRSRRAAILAAAIRRAEPDLVICGMASTDGSMGVVPAMIAERLGWPAATLGATLALDGRTVTIRRDTDTASLTVQADLPAVVSVTDQSGEARYPSMKGILAAKKKPVEELTLDDLGHRRRRGRPGRRLDEGRADDAATTEGGRQGRHRRGRFRDRAPWSSSSSAGKYI